MLYYQFALPVTLFALGAITASFMGVVAARLHTGQSFLRGRSRCDACGKELSPLQLVPIFSYIGSRGRAMCCGAGISILSPLVEILLGILFVISYLKLGLSVSLLITLVSLALMLALVLYDFAHQILPPVLLIPFVLSSAIAAYVGASSFADLMHTGFIALILAGILAALHFGSRGRAMGLADTPFVLGLAFLVGPLAISGFVYSFWIGAVVGIWLLLGRPKGSRMGVEVPFAPFLAAGFLLAYFTQWNLLLLLAGSLS
ncbi:MAG: prepilin peptidase [Parcubacteria group bacterium]|nr:prepilin peptidase [Parcubacteria group bacterium]